MSASEAREAVSSAISALGDFRVAPFECLTVDEDEAGEITVVCSDRRRAEYVPVAPVFSFTIDMEKYHTFDQVRTATLDRLCDYLLNAPRSTGE